MCNSGDEIGSGRCGLGCGLGLRSRADCEGPYSRQILTPQLEETGAVIRNIFPGCNGRGCCNALRQADNMQVTFPPGSDAAMRAVLLGAGVLAQYTFFSGRVRSAPD